MRNNQFAAALKSRSPAPQLQPAARSPSASKSGGKRKHVGGYFSPDIAKQLRLLASEEETTVQELLTEALRLLFKKRGLSVL